MLSSAMGMEGKDIMFSSNDTPAEEFEYAAKIGATINLDDITHIEFLEKTILPLSRFSALPPPQTASLQEWDSTRL